MPSAYRSAGGCALVEAKRDHTRSKRRSCTSGTAAKRWVWHIGAVNAKESRSIPRRPYAPGNQAHFQLGGVQSVGGRSRASFSATRPDFVWTRSAARLGLQVREGGAMASARPGHCGLHQRSDLALLTAAESVVLAGYIVILAALPASGPARCIMTSAAAMATAAAAYRLPGTGRFGRGERAGRDLRPLSRLIRGGTRR